MRIRRKPWARPELADCPFFIDDPEELRGQWRRRFKDPEAPLHLELGCGKGGFIAQLAPSAPQVNYIAVDIKSEMLGLAKRKLEAAYDERKAPADNILLTAMDIERLGRIFSPEDRIERIYINFCNPWPRWKDHKHRLTHTRQLTVYRDLMTDGAVLAFKTDDDELFRHTLGYLEEAGFKVTYKTSDLHTDGAPEGVPSPETEHEKMFSEQGVRIKFLTAEKLAGWERKERQEE